MKGDAHWAPRLIVRVSALRQFGAASMKGGAVWRRDLAGDHRRRTGARRASMKGGAIS
jgi:hypothetical protein